MRDWLSKRDWLSNFLADFLVIFLTVVLFVTFILGLWVGAVVFGQYSSAQSDAFAASKRACEKENGLFVPVFVTGDNILTYACMSERGTLKPLTLGRVEHK